MNDPLYLVAFTGTHDRLGGFVGSDKLPTGVDSPGETECRDLLERLFPAYTLVSPLERVDPQDNPVYITLWASNSVNGAGGLPPETSFAEWAILVRDLS